MYEYEGDEEAGGRSILRIAVGAAAVVALAGGAWFVASGRSGGDDNADTVTPADSTVAATPRRRGERSTDARPRASDSTAPPDASAPASSTAPAAADSTSTSVGTTAAPSTTVASSTTAAPTTTAASTTTRAPRPRPAPTTTAAPRPVTYDTMPDGTPAPLVAVFDVSQITLTGAVPDQAAKDRAQALALANAKPGQGNIANFLTINPDVPRSIGVRVVELTSARFPEGSAEVRPAHALELDRVVSIMNALPKITALVIGHADQRGDEATNYALSEQRADSVVNYVASKGIPPSRLSSRAVGEADLLTLNNDDAALALNRRTELVFYGLLIE